MTQDIQDERLSTLLGERDEPWRAAEGLLVLLAAAATNPVDVVAELFRRMRSAKTAPAWRELAAWLKAWPRLGDTPEDVHAWLKEFEDVGLAYSVLSRLGEEREWTASLREEFGAVVERFQDAVGGRTDLARYAGEAEARTKELGMDVAPWAWFAGGTVSQLLEAGSESTREALELWINGRLHSADARILAEKVKSERGLLEAYRNVLEETTRELWLTRWSPRWSLDVARSLSDLPDAQELLHLKLPHNERELTVLQHSLGTWWRQPDGSEELVPFERNRHAWRDSEVGEFVTSIHCQDPDVAEDRWHGLTSLQQVASGHGGKRGQDVAFELAADLRDGALGKALEEGTDCFLEGFDTSETLERLVSHAFETRITMPDALRSLSDRGFETEQLEAELWRVDQTHAGRGAALQLIPERNYRELTDGIPLDRGAWWGSRARLDARVPVGVVENALRRIGIEERPSEFGADVIPLSSKRRDVPAFSSGEFVQRRSYEDYLSGRLMVAEQPASYAAAPEELDRGDREVGPCPWMSGPGEILAGRVPLLLIDEHQVAGAVAELQVSQSTMAMGNEADVWRDAQPLRRTARDVIRRAYHAAGRCTSLRIPPRSFAQHRLRFVSPDVANLEHVTVDGPSLGLAASIALASAWLGKPVDRDIAAAATVDREGRIGRVGGATIKAAGLTSFSMLENVRVLCAPEDAGAFDDAGLTPVEVRSLSEALEVAGVALGELVVVPESIDARERALAELTNDVRNEAPFRQYTEITWTDLGDQMRFLIEGLANESTERDLDKDRCMAALAYSHDGMMEGVHTVLPRSRPSESDAEARTLYDIVRLGGCIDLLQLDEPEGQQALSRLEADLEGLSGRNHERMLGQAYGTLGRAYMHLRELSRALPLLEEAVTHHITHARHETARSRVYLSMALRMAGETDDALAQLDMAGRELREWTRSYSPEYEAACRVYYNYEKARALICAERFADAVTFADQAFRECSWMWWPQLGVLRTRAWAYRMLGENDSAEADVQRMQQWLSSVPQAARPLADRLVEEAKRYPTDDGEIY